MRASTESKLKELKISFQRCPFACSEIHEADEIASAAGDRLERLIDILLEDAELDRARTGT